VLVISLFHDPLIPVMTSVHPIPVIPLYHEKYNYFPQCQFISMYMFALLQIYANCPVEGSMGRG